MKETKSEAMEQAISELKEQVGPLVEIAEYALEAMANSELPAHIATFIEKIRIGLVERGFTRGEAMDIITTLDISSMIKQGQNK